MTNDTIDPWPALGKSPNASFFREMISFAAEGLIELELGVRTDAASGESSWALTDDILSEISGADRLGTLASASQLLDRQGHCCLMKSTTANVPR